MNVTLLLHYCYTALLERHVAGRRLVVMVDLDARLLEQQAELLTEHVRHEPQLRSGGEGGRVNKWWRERVAV